eukprot:tig00000237_g20474.t1
MSDPTLFVAAMAAHAASRPADAAKLYGEYLKSGPSASALCNRAECYIQLDLLRQAVRDCEAALAIDVNCLQAYYRKGLALHRMGKLDDARGVWLQGSRATGDIDVHLALRRAYESGPPDAQAAPAEPSTSGASGGRKPRSARGSPTPQGDSEEEGEARIVAQENMAREMGPELVEQVAERLKKSAETTGRMEDLVGVGVLFVNTGQYEKAVDFFSELLTQHRGKALVPALLGRGSALALLGRLDAAIRDFGEAIRRDGTCGEAYKRRGQCLAAKGREEEAVEDLSRAAELQPEEDVFAARGALYHKLRNYRRGAADLRRALEMGGPGKHVTWNTLGLCLTQLGECNQAVDAFRKAAELEPGAREPWSNMAQAYRELALFDEALAHFDAALERDATYGHAVQLRAALHHGPARPEARHFLAVLLHQTGQLREAVAEYTRALELQPSHGAAFAGREVATFWQRRLDAPWRSYNIDAVLDPRVKELACRRRTVDRMRYRRLELAAGTGDVELREEAPSEAAGRLLPLADRLGRYVQNRVPGFLANRRQHRALGLAAIEMAQTLRAHWEQARGRAGRAGAGRAEQFGPGASKAHVRLGLPFGWRDFFDIAVRWRQYSEPNDPVWWVDRLTKEEFAAGFGSQTPMYSGQMKVPRYYPNYAAAMAIMRELTPQQCPLTPDQQRAVKGATEVGELHSIVKSDYYVITPCHSTARPGRTMEGTRLTIQARPPEGYEFSIRTPGTPARQEEFDRELAHAWKALWEAGTAPQLDLDAASDAALTLAFYWYNCMPLSRGSAAIGHVAIIAAHLAFGYEVAREIPEGHQIDWEAILRCRPADFLAAERAWMYPARAPSPALRGLPLVETALPTLRAALQALNALPCPAPGSTAPVPPAPSPASSLTAPGPPPDAPNPDAPATDGPASDGPAPAAPS